LTDRYSYIFNRGWIDRSAGRVPTYKEVTKGVKIKAANDEPHTGAEDDADANPELDDEFEDVVDHFESSYNFRFEEPYVTYTILYIDLTIT
jgi:protein KRI1